MCFKKNYSLIIFILLGFKGFSQSSSFKNFSLDNGLPQAYIYDITQSSDGFLHVATGEGIGSYGGTAFKKINKSSGLAENFVNSVYTDKKETIWLGHYQEGISIIRKGKISKISSNKYNISKISSFVEDEKNQLYFAVSSGIYKIVNDSIVPFLLMEDAIINKIFMFEKILFIATNEGLGYINLRKSNKITYLNETVGQNITCADWDPEKKKLWVGSESNGIYVFYKEGDIFFSLLQNIKSELEDKNLPIRDLKKVGNTIWASIYGDGIRVLELDETDNILSVKAINNSNGLNNLFITKIFLDKENNIWLGSFGDGLFQYVSGRFELFNKVNGLGFDNIINILIDENDNKILIGQNNVEILKIEKSTSHKNILLDYTNKNDVNTCSFYNKKNKSIIIGTKKTGIYTFEFKNGNYVFKKINKLNGITINYITIDKNGNYLVCTTEGLLILNSITFDLIKSFTTNLGLPHNNITGCYVDHFDKLWLFSPGTPLYYIDGEFITLLKDIEGLHSFQFNGATKDANGDIWFSTEGDGIYKYHNSKFFHYSVNDGLNSDYAYSISTDKNNTIIVGHKNGLSIKYLNNKNFKAISKSNELPFYAFNLNSCAIDKSGSFWLGSAQGLVKYNPKLDKINYSPPILNFISVSFNDKIQNIEDSSYLFNYNDYKLKINYSGVSLTNPKEVSYQYTLIGYDSELHTTFDNEITYPVLKDGKYRFIITAKNSDGFITQYSKSFSFTIKPPFWKKIWFYIIVFILFFTLFFVFYLYRTASLRKNNKILSMKIANKTKELVIEKEKVEEANALMEIKNKLLAEKNNDFMASVNYAKRIQNAILSKRELIDKHLNNYIFYIPKDIVSGDFYWFVESDDFYFIAAVDCTGHGVPGAFMSLIGSTLLSRIVHEKKIHNPAEILKNLNKEIIESLKQNDIDSSSRDGMDIAICRFNKDFKKLIFSGAGRPLYHVRNNDLVDYKGLSFSVGGHYGLMNPEYSEIEIDLMANDMIFISSDGYVDQFNQKGKKFSSKRMRELFSEISSLTLSEQFEQVKLAHNNWKGEGEQIDDILVIGIRI